MDFWSWEVTQSKNFVNQKTVFGSTVIKVAQLNSKTGTRAILAQNSFKSIPLTRVVK